ncbi:hypothetical protein ABT294_42640 [Nonomuraea sp. NPDC000554]|uniref:hypothetical protein n=1 Tax=Nonomuraea sp. NPDC000554 TaxID=3154259 RepID=UPI0033207011
MTTGISGSSDLKGDTGEESGVAFDPEATGVIPRLTFAPSKDSPADSPNEPDTSDSEPSGAPSDAASDTPKADADEGAADEQGAVERGADDAGDPADRTDADAPTGATEGERPDGDTPDPVGAPTESEAADLTDAPTESDAPNPVESADVSTTSDATEPSGAPGTSNPTDAATASEANKPTDAATASEANKPTDVGSANETSDNAGTAHEANKPTGTGDNGDAADAGDGSDGEDAAHSGDADTTTQIRLPRLAPLHIGSPPTADEATQPDKPVAETPGDPDEPPPPGAQGSASEGTPAGEAERPEGAPGDLSAAGTQPFDAVPQSVTPPGTPSSDATSPSATSSDATPSGAALSDATPLGATAPGGAPAVSGAAEGGEAGLSEASAAEVTAAVRLPGKGAPTGPQSPPTKTPLTGPQATKGTPAEAPATKAPPAASGPAKAPRARGLAALVQSAPKWLPVLLTLEGLIMYVLALKAAPGPLRGVNPADINGLGLIAALPLSAFAAILIMLVSFFVTVAQRTDRKFLLLFQIAAITFALHGAGALVATEPRFPTAYIHAGFVEFIGRTGETAINIDARMGWPGFFALFAFVTKAAGISDMTTVLQWTPLLSNLLYLLPFVLILRQVVATTRARWFAALLFVLVQWIGQDYFSPQGFTFALYLAFVAILLRWFGRVEPRTKPIAPKGLRKLLGRLDAMTPGELANTGTFRADKLLMLLMLIALFFAATASHQITPFMMLGVVTAFLLVKRTSLTWALPFFFGLVVAAWISYETVGFWAGQIDAIFGGLGRIFDNIQSNTGDRIAGSDPAHALVLKARLGILVVILALAATGLLRRLRRGVFDRAALILLCVPVLALGLQSYGGEIGLRIYMFALPGACLLAAYAFFPNLPADSADVREETVPIRRRNVRFNPELTKRISVVLAACFAVLFAMAFLVARYGNEKFERVTSGEIAAMHYVYQHDKPSARVVYLVPEESQNVTPTLPWGERDVDLVNFNGQARVYKDPKQIAGAVAKLKASPRNTYLAVSLGQVSYLQLNEGFPADWGPKFRAALDASPDLKKVFSNDDAALYTLKKFVKGTEIPEPQPYKGRGDPTSPWTPVGLGALAVTWVSLFGYEVIRLNGPNRAPRARKRLLFVAIPAFVVAVAVIIERFVYIAVNN